jgi:hypothetical protein
MYEGFAKGKPATRRERKAEGFYRDRLAAESLTSVQRFYAHRVGFFVPQPAPVEAISKKWRI